MISDTQIDILQKGCKFMFWLISIAMLIIGCLNHNDTLIVSSGLFAIAGSIDIARTNKSKEIK